MQPRLWGVALSFSALLAASPSSAATFEPPSGAPQMEVTEASGAKHAAYSLGESAEIGFQGPGEIKLLLYVSKPGRLTVSLKIDNGTEKVHRLHARPVRVVSPANLTAVASLALSLKGGAHVVSLRTEGGVLAIEGATPRPSIFLAPLIPPVAKQEAPPPGYRRIEANEVGDEAASKPAAAVKKPAEPAPEAEQVRVALRVGALLPRTELGTGFEVAGEVGYVLPIEALQHRLRIQLGAGYALSPYQGPKIVPGRGYDPNFTQNTTIVPIDLSAVYALPLGASGIGFYGGAGVGMFLVSTTFQSFDATSEAGDVTFGPVAQLGLEYPVGPGRLVGEARYMEANADLGQLGQVGQDTLGSFSFTAGYAMGF